MSAVATRPTTWAVTRIEHPALRGVREDCADCLALTDSAITHAGATGSSGCTYSDDRTRTGGQLHSVTVARVIQVVTR
jgi:hypothetical protein